MKNLRLIAGILSALTFALLISACTSAQAGYTRIRELRTYAIVAVDDQGVLSQSDLAKIRIGIVQYLTDEGYVHGGERFGTRARGEPAPDQQPVPAPAVLVQ